MVLLSLISMQNNVTRIALRTCLTAAHFSNSSLEQLRDGHRDQLLSDYGINRCRIRVTSDRLGGAKAS